MNAMVRVNVLGCLLALACVNVNTPIPSVEDRIALMPAVLELTTGTLVIKPEDVQEVADAAAASPAEVRALGLVEGEFYRRQAGEKQLSLEPRSEKELLAAIESFKERFPRSETPTAESPPELLARANDMRELAATIFGSDDAMVRRLDPLAMKGPLALWEQLTPLSNRTYKMARVKSAARDYLEYRARRTSFSRAVQLTLQVGSNDKSPIIMGRRVRVMVPEREELPSVDFDLVEENCIPERAVCTARYRVGTGQVRGSTDLEAVLKEPEEEWRDLSIGIKLLVNGELLEKEYPAAYLVRRTGHDDPEETQADMSSAPSMMP